MSAGEFTRTRYQTDSGSILRCRVQPETLALTIGGTANSAPASQVDDEGSVLISSRRRNGVNARYVSLAWTGSPPAGYKEGVNVRVPVLQKSTFDAWALDATGTYLGAGVRLAGKTNEKVV